MVGYSRVARSLEQNVGATAVAELNAQVQRFVDAGLRAAGRERPDVVRATTGDGAILVFDSAEEAHRFAAAAHAAAKAHSARLEPSAKRRFRTGAATGEIVQQARPGGYDMAGVTIANAVRLEAASRPGVLLIDIPTYDALPESLRVAYAAEEVVRGKGDETFRARRCVMDADADDAAAGLAAPPAPAPRQAPNRPEIVRLFSKLYPPSKLDTLMFLLEMPLSVRPPHTLWHDERCNLVLQWAESPAGVGLPRLEAELRQLLTAD
jgi:class 3 adenylate cyclase